MLGVAGPKRVVLEFKRCSEPPRSGCPSLRRSRASSSPAAALQVSRRRLSRRGGCDASLRPHQCSLALQTRALAGKDWLRHPQLAARRAAPEARRSQGIGVASHAHDASDGPAPRLRRPRGLPRRASRCAGQGASRRRTRGLLVAARRGRVWQEHGDTCGRAGQPRADRPEVELGEEPDAEEHYWSPGTVQFARKGACCRRIERDLLLGHISALTLATSPLRPPSVQRGRAAARFYIFAESGGASRRPARRSGRGA